jgi:hypothetical protein
MEQVLCEPVELTEFELDAVAGGNPFGTVTGNVTNSGHFATGAVLCHVAVAIIGTFAGQVNTFGTNIASGK